MRILVTFLFLSFSFLSLATGLNQEVRLRTPERMMEYLLKVSKKNPQLKDTVYAKLCEHGGEVLKIKDFFIIFEK